MTYEFAKYPDGTLGVFSISLHYFQIVEKWKIIHFGNIRFYW